ncbi:hypothetical protein RB628_01565 [Streptomyces sp. ADMS]|uniref:hypothetical protein n=1 Tax=Streptomyces sp. ADMS TaxID=3071415 RepID=UPI00296E8E7F|nr:hypothetical protein [Streptomyces sp. ADMS]MDW4904055.1 hypothetical protein [Streptomyces sp. ADMS]
MGLVEYGHELVAAPSAVPLLFGRGTTRAAESEALGHLLHRLSRTACDVPQPSAADLDPAPAGPHGLQALGAACSCCRAAWTTRIGADGAERVPVAPEEDQP